MGILDALGLKEEDLNPFALPPSTAGEPIPVEDEEDIVQGDGSALLLEEGGFVDVTPHSEHSVTPDIEEVLGYPEDGPDYLPPPPDPHLFGGTVESFPNTSESVIREIQEECSIPAPPEKPKSKYKKVEYSVSCTLHVSGSDYIVVLLPQSADYDKGYHMLKVGSKKTTEYNVLQMDGEIICECYDFKFRRDGSDSKGCKHIRALVDMGMFAAPPVFDPSKRKSLD